MNHQIETRDDAVTSGSDSRPGRDLRSPQALDLMAEASALFDEPEWAERDRNSRTIASGDLLRVTLTALRAGAELGSEGNDDTLAVQVLRGAASVELDEGSATLTAGQLVTMAAPGRWRLRAQEDALLLLTVAAGRAAGSGR